jgi:hypothetical protein
MPTNTLAGLSLADVRVAVAVAEYTQSEGTTIGWVVMVSCRARLAELAYVTGWTAAVFYPIGWFTHCAQVCSFQMHIIQVTLALMCVRSTNFDSS